MPFLSLPHKNIFRRYISKLPSSSFFPRNLNQAKVEGSGKNTTWETLMVERPQTSQMHTKPQVAFMNCCKHCLRVRNTSNQGFIPVVLRFEVKVLLLWQHPEGWSVGKLSTIYLLQVHWFTPEQGNDYRATLQDKCFLSFKCISQFYIYKALRSRE